MKKILLILIFGILVNVTFSQEVKAIYKFKKEQQKKMFKYSESDSLILYSNGNFYRKYFYQYHEIDYSEVKGNWKIENGILNLNITGKKESVAEENWTDFKGIFRYSIVRKRLIPINDSFEIYATQKLKLIEQKTSVKSSSAKSPDFEVVNFGFQPIKFVIAFFYVSHRLKNTSSKLENLRNYKIQKSKATI